MDKVVEDTLDAQFQELLSTFKPQFGNQLHIDIRERLEVIAEKEKLLNHKVASARGAFKLNEELSRLKRQGVHLLKDK